MSRLVVGPFNRVEGDLEVRLTFDGYTVSEAHVVSPMFRGFETILLDRAPEDALAIAPRICGICSVSQSVAAATALAKMAHVIPPMNGQFSTQLTLACENLSDHLTHFYLFFMPDFTNAVYENKPWHEELHKRFCIPDGTSRLKAMEARAKFLHVTGIIAGKWPHTLAIQPGGTTLELDQGARIRLMRAIEGYRNFLERDCLGLPLEAFSEINSIDALRDELNTKAPSSDLALLLKVFDDLDLWSAGPGADQFISFGAYPINGEKTLRQGVWDAGEIKPVDTGAIIEDISHAKYPSMPTSPAESHSDADPEKADAYSWCKAPRYKGRTAEVGAYARQLIDGAPLIKELHSRTGSSVAGRILARWVETARIVPLMEIWAHSLQRNENYLSEYAPIEQGEGIGLVEAARGALGHWMRVENGLISNYQIIAPTTWNFSPRDANGVAGPLETALVGAKKLEGEKSPVSVQHIVRSFDPCMVCTAH